MPLVMQMTMFSPFSFSLLSSNTSIAASSDFCGRRTPAHASALLHLRVAED